MLQVAKIVDASIGYLKQGPVRIWKVLSYNMQNNFPPIREMKLGYLSVLCERKITPVLCVLHLSDTPVFLLEGATFYRQL